METEEQIKITNKIIDILNENDVKGVDAFTILNSINEAIISELFNK